MTTQVHEVGRVDKSMLNSLFVVACTDLHYAYGIVLGLESATKLARILTDKSECVFLPVPLITLGAADLRGQLSSKTPDTRETLEKENYRKGYL